jgi:hypothetical protein
MKVRLAQFLKFAGVPVQVPMRNTGLAGVNHAELMF